MSIRPGLGVFKFPNNVILQNNVILESGFKFENFDPIFGFFEFDPPFDKI